VLDGAIVAERNESTARGASKLPRRVLVVENEALICVETADTFEQQGFEVHIALSGEEALRRIRGGLVVDVLFTDIDLGGAMDGTALARLAREIMPAVTVAYTSGSVEAVAQRVAGSVFIPKPYSPDRVGRMLSGMCAAKARLSLAGQSTMVLRDLI
jgi:CheY-like chemotaxis protein